MWRALPVERYRVEKYLVADPADVDGDCIDDLADPNPVNPGGAIDFSDGAVAIPDRETFEALAYDGGGGRLHVKFVLLGMGTDRPIAYFQNHKENTGHITLLNAVGAGLSGSTLGQINFAPGLIALDGSAGVYWFSLRPFPSSFSFAERAYSVLGANLQLLQEDLAFYVANTQLDLIQSELSRYQASRLNLLLERDVFAEVDYLALNPEESFGRLQLIDPDDRPHPRDIVIYETLPNNLPPVAGIISTVPQTPLSHVNLRAAQNGAPNAYIQGALSNTNISSHLGDYVHYSVTKSGYTVRAATQAEVDTHFASLKPSQAQTPERDLSLTEIAPLREIGFDDWDAFGVKAANVAVLGKLGLPAATVPDGFAVPFYFYDEFMKANELYDDIKEMLADEEFQSDYDEQEDELKTLRKKIKEADSPQWIIDALTAMHGTYPEGQSLRYRSSTNNEDLPGFNGAGLYDSKTQHADETEEDGIDKSLKQVYASLWNFRAFTERELHRIDHMQTAMGVLVHPNYSDELANGVAVSFDPVYGSEGEYYVNTQLGEDLVTNPEAHSVPEEILLASDSNYIILGVSNLVEQGQILLSGGQLRQLRRHLEVIHDHFENLYNPAADEPFAMEIEFKITSNNRLAIKQARPWVFETSRRQRSQSTSTNSGGGGGFSFGPAPMAPSFVDGFRTTRSVAENVKSGDAVGDPIQATHPDELAITYSLSGADAALFTVDEETGQLWVKEGGQLTEGETCTVNLTATDSSGVGAIIIVEITVMEATVSPYDLNGNGRIDRDEIIEAVTDYFKGLINKEALLELIKLYFAG